MVKQALQESTDYALPKFSILSKAGNPLISLFRNSDSNTLSELHLQVFHRLEDIVHHSYPTQLGSIHCTLLPEAVIVHQDEELYEVGANTENWMITGRERGHESLLQNKVQG
ncbi:hypothetical protein FF1_030767 [Malus domestica]